MLPPLLWNWSVLYILIIALAGYGYSIEKTKRINRDKVIRELLIVHDAEISDCSDLITGLTQMQLQQNLQIFMDDQAKGAMRQTIYEMYHELRKYDKTLPPWGGDKPLDPTERDKWTSTRNDT